MPLYRFLNVVYAQIVATKNADARAELDDFLSWDAARPVEQTEPGAPDWWRGEEAEAVAMLAQMGGGRG